MSRTNWTAELNKIQNRAAGLPDLEKVFTHPDYCAVTTATPLQRALCRVISGKPLAELAQHPHVLEAMGDQAGRGKVPLEIYFAAGIRSGKSLLNAAIMIYVALTIDVTATRVRVDRGELPRISLVSTQKDVADATMDHFVGTCERSPLLSKCLTKTKKGYIFTQPHTGHQIEVVVVANKKQGSSLVGRWQALVIFDEISRMASAGRSEINVDDARKGVLGRIMKGGYILGTGSPTAPVGMFYDVVTKYKRKCDPETLVIQAQGPWLNPEYWTPERVQLMKDTDEDVYVTDCLGEFASPASSMFPLSMLDRSIRPSLVLPPSPGASYVAAMDPGLSGNSWTLVVGTREGHMRKVVLAHEWVPTKLKPNNAEDVMRQIAGLLSPYGITDIATDQYAFELVRQVGAKFGLNVYQMKNTPEIKRSNAMNLQSLMIAGCIELPPVKTLKVDLLNVKKVPQISGGYTVHEPQTPDGRHCDFFPALLLALGGYCNDIVGAPIETPYVERLEAMIEREAVQRVKRSLRDAKRRR